MKRREFLLTGIATVAWPRSAVAENSGRKKRIGVLDVIGKDDPGTKKRMKAFLERLQQLGWLENVNVEIDVLHAEGKTDELYKLARDLVEQSVDVLVTSGTPAILAAKKASSTTPIVFATIGDPVGAGVVASLSHPGGNVTGLSLLATDLSKKRLEILKEALPRLRRVAILWNPNNPSLALQLRDTEEAARLLRIELQTIPAVTADDFSAGIAAARNNNADALLLTSDAKQIAVCEQIIEEASLNRLPVAGEFRRFADAGALLSYGPNTIDNWRRAADYVDKILKGEKPSDIPVEQPVRFELVINLKTANALGLEIPPTLLTRADEVIE